MLVRLTRRINCDDRSTKASYQRYRRSIDKLADTMDAEVARQLAALLGMRRPW